MNLVNLANLVNLEMLVILMDLDLENQIILAFQTGRNVKIEFFENLNRIRLVMLKSKLIS